MSNGIQIPADAFKDLECPYCGHKVFNLKHRVKIYEGILSPMPVTQMFQVLFCDHCKKEFEPKKKGREA